MAVNAQMNKQNVVNALNGILLGHKKEWNTTASWYNMDEPWKYKRKKPITKAHILSHFAEMKV